MELRDLLTLAMLAFVAWRIAQMVLGKTSPAKARALVEEGALLLDVRSPGEFLSGHVKGAMNIPVNELGARLGELGEKSKAVVVYCASGMRSATASGVLKRAGFTQVFDLGAMSRWSG